MSGQTIPLLALALAGLLLSGCLDINNMSDLKEAVGANDVIPPPAEIEPPIVKLVASTTSARVGEPVQLSADGSVDPQSQPLSYVWDLGDETLLRGPRISHTYATPGKYLVALTVTNAAGLSTNATHRVEITSVNGLPVAAFEVLDAQGSPVTSLDVNSAVRFTAVPSSDPEGEPLKYHWDLGDGRTATDPTLERAFEVPGRYSVVLTVTDAAGQLSRASRDLAVNQNATLSGLVGQGSPYWEGGFFTNLPQTMEITLTYQAKTGTEVLSLTLKDGASRTVANATAASGIGKSGLVTKTITLPRDVILQHGRGEWDAVVSFDRGVSLDVPFNVQVIQRY